MGPLSLKALLALPIAGIELAGFGGTNFSQIEIMRNTQSDNTFSPITQIGHSAHEMILMLNKMHGTRKIDIIISGGVKNFLDGYYLLEESLNNAVIGQAKNFLVYALNYESLKVFVQNEIEGLKLAHAYLQVKESVRK